MSQSFFSHRAPRASTSIALSLIGTLAGAGLLAQEAATPAPAGAAGAKGEKPKPAARLDDKQAAEIQRILDATGSGVPAGPAKTAQEARKSDPEAKAIIEKYLEARGGRDLLAAIKDRTARYRNIKYAATGETEADLALYMRRGYKYREEWEIKGFKIADKKLAFVQIYNGDEGEGWVKMFDTVSPLEGRTLAVFVWDKHLDDFFVNWEQDGYTVHSAGDGLVEDEEASIVRVVDFSGRQSVRYFFSKTSGLLLKKEWIDTTQKESAKKEQFYQAYRPIGFSDGSGRSVKFAIKLDIYVDGDLDTERVYTEVRFNSGLSDALFAKPEGKPFAQRPKLTDTQAGGGEAGEGHGDRGRRRRPVIHRRVPHPSATTEPAGEKKEGDASGAGSPPAPDPAGASPADTPAKGSGDSASP